MITFENLFELKKSGTAQVGIRGERKRLLYVLYEKGINKLVLKCDKHINNGGAKQNKGKKCITFI